MTDKLSVGEVEVLLAGYREKGKVMKASLAGALVEALRENERLRGSLEAALAALNGDFSRADALSNKHPSLYLHGPVTTTKGDVREPGTWETTEEHPPQNPSIPQTEEEANEAKLDNHPTSKLY